MKIRCFDFRGRKAHAQLALPSPVYARRAARRLVHAEASPPLVAFFPRIQAPRPRGSRKAAALDVPHAAATRRRAPQVEGGKNLFEIQSGTGAQALGVDVAVILTSA